MSKMSGKSMGKRQSSDLSLGAIDEDSVFDTLGDDDDEQSPQNKFTRRDLFENELSVIDVVGSPTGGGTFIDLEAEERAFVSGSQQYLEAMETIRQLQQRLVRRTAIIDEIRKYYLRDVVTIKHIMKDVLTTGERQKVLKMHVENLPSIDLKQALVLHAPTKCELQVSHCGECGGQLEIIMKDSDEVDMLKKVIVDCKNRESRFRIKLATLDAQIESTTIEKAEASKSHAEEKKFLYAEMKKIKAEVEKVQNDLSKVNKINKRAQSDNEALQAKINTLSQASKQLETAAQEIDSLRTELGEATVALKSVRQTEKAAMRDLAERTVELKEMSLKVEEQSETLKHLRAERDEQQAEICTLKDTMNDWIMKYTETSEQQQVSQERVAELEAIVEEQAVEHDKMMALLNASDDDLKLEMVELEDECIALKTEKKSLTKENEKLKNQLEKAQEHKLVLEHDLAVAQHEIKQRDEELHSIQNFIHDKMGKTQTSTQPDAGGVTMKMEDVLHSIKAEARSRAGDAPAVSAKVATVKAMHQQEAIAMAEAAAAAVLAVQTGSAPPSRKGKQRRKLGGLVVDGGGDSDDDDDDIGNFDREDDPGGGGGGGEDAAGGGAGRKTPKKKGSVLRKARNVLRASMSSPSGEQKATRRRSMEAKPVTPSKASAGVTKKKKAVKKARSGGDEDGGGGDDVGEEEHHSDGEEEHDDDSGAGGTGGAEEEDGAEQKHQEGEAEDAEGDTKKKKSKTSVKDKEKPPTKKSKSKDKEDVAGGVAGKAKKGKSAGQSKRRRSFDGSEGPTSRPGTGTTEPDALPGSNPTSRASSRGASRPSTRESGIDSARRRRSGDAAGEEPGGDVADDQHAEGSDGDGDGGERRTGIATADSFGENEALTQRSSRKSGKSVRSETEAEAGAHDAPQEHQEEAGDAANDDADVGADDEGAYTDNAEATNAAAKSTNKPPSGGAKKVLAVKSRARKPASAVAADESETDGEAGVVRTGSREGGRRSRLAPAKPKYTNSKDIKKEALEASGSSKQTRINKVSPSLRNKEPRAPRQSRKPKLQTRRESGGEGAETPEEVVEEEEEEDEELQEEEDEEEDGDEGEYEFDDQLEEEEEEQEEESAEQSEDDDDEDEEEEEVQVVVKKEKAREVKKVAAITITKKKAAEPKKKTAKVKVQTVAKGDEEEEPVSPLGSPGRASVESSHSHASSTLPLPKRRRSIPKSFSFYTHSMAELSADNHSIQSHGSHDSLDSLALANAVTKTVSKIAPPAVSSPSPPLLPAQPITQHRKKQLDEEFKSGAHRVADPPSILDDDDLRDRAHIKSVPVIPIEVKRYIGNVTHKMPIVTEEVIALEPLAAGATPFEVKLRADLLRVMKSYPGAKESEAHKMLNASNKTLHQFCDLYSRTIESTWTSLKANRAALDLHFTMKAVIEGMAGCTEVKSGTVELADTCKRIIPVAGLSPLGPAVTQRWQEEVKLHDAVFSALLPTVDAATGKITVKESSDFFNTNLLDPTAKVAGAINILIDKVKLAQESAVQMHHYAADASKAVSEKLVGVLRDWAKVKNAFYEMDSKIAAEKDKVRKVLESRIADLTKEKASLGVVCNKHEERIRVLEGVERQLENANLHIKKCAAELLSRDETIVDLENDVLALQDEISAIKAREGKKDEYIDQLKGQVAGLEVTVQDLKTDIAQRLAELAQGKVQLGEVSEERDHFQAQYKRMVQQEYNRLNKLVTIHVQCEPSVQDLAIQTEFVAPPMNLRTMVASKNARGKKAPLILSQSLEIPPSDPGILTSSMVDTAASTFHPLRSSGASSVLVGHGSTSRVSSGSGGGPGSTGSSFPMLISPPLSSQSRYGRMGSPNDRPIWLSEDTNPSNYITNTSSTPSAASQQQQQQGHGISSRESSANDANMRTFSREESFLINATDFLAAAPINYELSSRSRVQADSIQEISRLLGGNNNKNNININSNNDDSMSVGSTNTRIYSGDRSSGGGGGGGGGSHVTKRKAVKLSRIPHQQADPSVGSSGHYQHVHNEEKVPQWGTVHSTVPTSTVNINPGVVLGISGVGSIGGHTNKQLSAFGNRIGGEGGGGGGGGGIGSTSTLSAAGSSLFRTTLNNPSRTKGLEIEVGLPEVKVQSYNVPSAQRPHGNHSLAQQITNSINDAANMRASANNSSGSMNGISGLSFSCTSEKSVGGSHSPEMYLMLDSPTLGGSSKQMGYDFEKDRKQLLRIAGELPPSQEEVGGIIYNHRNNGGGGATVTFRTEDSGAELHQGGGGGGGHMSDHSAAGSSSMMHSASQGSVTRSHANKAHSNSNSTNKPQYKVNHQATGLQQDSAHSAVSGVSEDILKRLRKELLSR